MPDMWNRRLMAFSIGGFRSRLIADDGNRRTLARRAATICIALCVALAVVVPALAAESLIRISTDPYTNPDSQHRTQVEPDTFAFGSTIVSAFQSGRYFNGGASNIGWALSTNNGASWVHGFLPRSTDKATPPGPYQRASDASVAYDAKHQVWLISWLGLLTPNPANESSFKVDVLVSRSTDGGKTFGSPVTLNPNPATAGGTAFLDKNWTVCDNTLSSPFYGNCYTEYDDNSRNDLVLMQTSFDGGVTWGAPKPTGDQPNGFSIPAGTPGSHGLGGQPLVMPDGRVVVPYLGFDDELNPAIGNPTFTISSFVSPDGGNSWSGRSLVSEVDPHTPPGNLRADLALPSAEIDNTGRAYVTWADCRFQPQCSVSDLVLSTSTNGTVWSAVRRIPLDPIGSGADHFLPGLAVDRNGGGGSAHLALVYYFYPDVKCSVATCQLEVGFSSSRNGGSSWSPHETLAGPMQLSWLPNTSQGFMVGDYFSTSIPPGSNVAVPVFEVASPPTGATLHQPTFAVQEDIAGGSLMGADIVVKAEPAIGATGSARAENGVPQIRFVFPTVR